MIIRRILEPEEDIKGVMEVERRCFPEHIIESQEIYEHRIKHFPNGIRVLEDNNKILGVISSEIWNYQDNVNIDKFAINHFILERHDPCGSELYISSLAIVPEYRKLGLSKQLLDGLIHDVKKEHPIITTGILMVSEVCEYAIKLYKKFNFKFIYTFSSRYFFPNLPHNNYHIMRCYELNTK